MTRILRNLLSTPDSAAPPPESAASLESDFVVILAALLCALISVVGLTAIARCAWLRRGPVAGNSPAPGSANKGLKKKVLNSLPKFTYLDGSPGKWVVSSECAICLSEFTAGEEVRVLPQCGHGFHVACVDTWLGSHSSCPSCRAPFAIARCQKCGLYQPNSAGAVAGETEPKSVGGDNAEVANNSNCVGNSVESHSHTVYNGFLP
ncbi:RING-H2 finger protein ATL80-like [Cicer arietinum]|uniref:RING-H2 finger protein ATL8-like n=1 Tax=Cicer arietinum TaxID=3827 RepID=A0A1S2YT37_CICAR|nr:RING-H2 finger protein ATL8-like [Cicer arietinum]